MFYRHGQSVHVQTMDLAFGAAGHRCGYLLPAHSKMIGTEDPSSLGDESAQSPGVSPAALASNSGGGGCFIGSTLSYQSWNKNYDGILLTRFASIGLLIFVGIGLFFLVCFKQKIQKS